MNRFLCTACVLAVSGFFLMAACSAMAEPVTYTANFDSNIEGWDTGGDGPYYSATDGQSGGYAGGIRNTSNPYLTPPTNSILYGDLASNFHSNQIQFSYYLKNFGGSTGNGGSLIMFADSDTTPGWDTIWTWLPSDNSVPTEWRQLTWTVDTTASVAPAGWSLTTGSGSWADSWKNVKFWNFWSGGGSGSINNGIDTVFVTAVPEPTTLMLVGMALAGLIAYAWKKR